MNVARIVGLVSLLAAVLAGAEAWAQGAGGRGPQQLTLRTKDGVQLAISYYPSPAGQNAVPVVMLHDFNETRAVFENLATALANPPRPRRGSPERPMDPRAVITVDLRGHGDSKTAFDPDGTPRSLDAQRFGPVDFADMAAFDMEAVRSFLVDQNDAGMLNLNKLTLVGSGMGANVAVLWAAKDWATPPLPTRKQGQDVKALVLLSPRWNYRGLELVEAMKFPPIQRQLSVYLAYGEDDADVVEENENILKILQRFHPEPRAGSNRQKDLYWYAPETRLQGSQLLNNAQFALAPKIIEFIEARVGQQAFPYVPRKR